MEEEWRDIKGFEGHYQVSNLARVRCLVDCHLRPKVPTIKKQHLAKDGYLKVSLYLHRHMKLCKPHRLVADAFIPNPLNLPCINHKDCNKLNNSIDNLEWCTGEYNTKHAHINGRFPKLKGAEVGAAIWTDQEVIDIKTDINLGLSTNELFNKYPKLNSKHLYLFRVNKTWTHLEVRCNNFEIKKTPRKKLKFSEEVIKKVETELLTGASQQSISDITGVSQNVVSRISRGVYKPKYS